MDLGLRGKRALVTGASKGIGKAVAEVLAAEGCDLELAARGTDALAEVARAITGRTNVRVRTHAADLSRSEDQQRLAEAVGDVDILVNNAGSNPAGEIDEISDQTWRASWDLKVFGYINLTRLVYQRMKARKAGAIVNVIGSSGERMNARYILGSSGNLALMGLTRALGARSPDFGVRVVGVNPGLTATDRAKFLLRGWSENKYGTPDRGADVLKDMNLPFGRMGEPSEVADLVAFLASPRAAYITGTIVTIDGGGANRS
ncbi:MAG: SDR family NAD(P)-dependent oxidoreductase [Alphaproteobacteria bacterium]|nr:SDR family NAD(P)-dependent oxidoreductase [Alphaproteobacteria bacterium]